MTSDDAQPKKRVGRPRKYPGTERRPTLTFRVTNELYEKLKMATENSSLSLSEQIERQLEKSFDLADMAKEISIIAANNMKSKLIAMSGGPEGWEAGRIFGNDFVIALAKAARDHNLNGKWYENTEVVNAVRDAMAKSIDDIVQQAVDLERWLGQARKPLTDEEFDRISADLDAPPAWASEGAGSADAMPRTHSPTKQEATKSEKKTRSAK